MVAEMEFLLRAALSLGVGAIIGLERESEEEAAGFRTHMLICLGAMLFTLLSTEFVGATDPSRVAAGLVTGIGFLGAGAIFKAENKIKGLTTAADLWVITAIGMSFGLGYYVYGLITALAVYIILYLKNFTHKKQAPKTRYL